MNHRPAAPGGDDGAGPIVALLGSAEFEPWTEPVDRHVLSMARPGPVAVLPTASWPDGPERFEAWGVKGVAHYARLGVAASVVPLRTRDDAFDPALIEAIHGASLLFFSGGRPSYLASVLAATPFWRALLDELDAGAAYAGCSAGACVLGEMAPDSVTERIFAPGWAPGLHLLSGFVVCPHWDALDEHEPGLREFHEWQVPDDCTLLAIDEETALVGGTQRWSVMGEGSVRLGRRGRGVRHDPGDVFVIAPSDALRPTRAAGPSLAWLPTAGSTEDAVTEG